MSRPVLADAFAHHVWATDRILAACEALDLAQLGSTVPGVYGSIIDTLRHTVEADTSYLALLSGGKVDKIDASTMDVEALRTAMRGHEPAWQELVAGDLDAGRELIRHREDGSTTTAPLGVRLAQALHHGSDHRSQVCTALTNLGIEPPEVDVWAWADEHGRLVETPPTR